MNIDTLPHPVEQLPGYMRNLTYAVAATLDVDIGMALSTLLSGMAAGVHGGFKVERPDGGLEPLALFSIVLAGPTVGKTRTHKLVHTAHGAEDIRRYLAYESNKESRLRSVILQDTTMRGLLEANKGVGESSSISSHEGQNVLGTPLFHRHLDTLNVLYDGDGKAMLTRSKGDIVSAFDASLNILVMVQPDIFESYLQKHGTTARGVGFLARCLFTRAPHLTAGVEPCGDDDELLAIYNKQVKTFLEAQLARLETGCTERQCLRFSPEACQLWEQLTHEHRQLTHSRYWAVQDAANRAMQNVARIAAIIHCYDTAKGMIGRETLYAAWAIVQRHMADFAQLFPPKAPPAPKPRKLSTRERQLQREFDDGRVILDCITEICWRASEPAALKSKVLVRSGLYNARFRTALMRLIDEGSVLESDQGNQMRLSITPQSPVRQFGHQGWEFSVSGSL